MCSRLITRFVPGNNDLERLQHCIFEFNRCHLYSGVLELPSHHMSCCTRKHFDFVKGETERRKKIFENLNPQISKDMSC